jgi:hypothetical protein
MTTETNQAAIQVFDAVLRADGSRCPRPDLERRFKHISPLSLNDAIATLVADGVLVEDGEDLRIPIADDDALAVALLAAVVNHALVTGSPPILTIERVCREVERDPAVEKERQEVLLALVLLDYCELAERQDDVRWSPTHAAVWAARLSF